MGMFRSRKIRRTRVIKVSKTARAIKSALAMSSVMLALAGSGEVFAQTCTAAGASITNCTGNWVDSTIDDTDFPTPDPNETVQVGVTGLTIVSNNGFDGVYADWDGNNTVIIGTAAIMSIVNAEGVYVDADTASGLVTEPDATISVNSLVTVEEDAAGQNAIDAYALGDVVINIGNAGAAITTNYDDSYDVVSVQAYAQNGNVTISNNDATDYKYGISATSSGGDATAVYATAEDIVTVQGGGDFKAFVGGDGAGDGGDATVIYVQGYDAVVNVSGMVYAYAYYGSATGIVALGSGSADGNADVTSSGELVVLTNDGGAFGTATGIRADAYNAVAENSGTMWVNVDNDGNTPFDPLLTYNALGISVSADATGEAINSGTMYLYAYGGYAIGLQSIGDDAIATNSGSIQATAINGYAYGAQVSGLYSATVDNSGTIRVTSVNDDAFGIHADSTDATALTTVTNDGNVTANANTTGDAIAVYAQSANDVHVYGDGAWFAHALGTGDATAIYATSSSGDVVVDVSGQIAADSVDGGATGIYANADAYTVTVTNAASIHVDGDTFATGIDAFGFTGASVTNNQYIEVDAVGAATGIAASSTGGNVSVTTSNNGEMNVSSTAGAATGIDAGTGGTGTVDINASGEIYVSSSAAQGTGDATGILAYSYDGDITIDGTGDFEILAYSNSDTSGIFAYTTAGGEGDIGIDIAGGTIHVEGYGYVYGIYALANTTGAVTIDVGSSRVDLQACKLEYSIVSPK